MDRFEKFFRDHRTRLDTEEPEMNAWVNVYARSARNRRNQLLRQLYTAASLTLIAVLSTLLLVRPVDRREHDQQLTPQGQKGLLTMMLADLAEEESEYMQQIDRKIEEIESRSIPEDYKGMFSEFTEQLELIDKQYEIYSAEVAQQGYSQELVRQIIYNYQLKLSVLQMLSNEIQKINNLPKERSHESTSVQFNL